MLNTIFDILGTVSHSLSLLLSLLLLLYFFFLPHFVTSIFFFFSVALCSTNYHKKPSNLPYDLHMVYSVPSIKQGIEGNKSNMAVSNFFFSIVDDKVPTFFIKKEKHFSKLQRKAYSPLYSYFDQHPNKL